MQRAVRHEREIWSAQIKCSERRSHGWTGVLAVVLLLLSCQQSDISSGLGAQPPAPSRTSSPRVSAPLTLNAIGSRARLAFRPSAEPATWSGGNATYGVTASADVLSVTPRYFPQFTKSAEPVVGVPATFDVRQIARGTTTLLSTAGEHASVSEHGVLLIPRGDAVERLQNTEGGVEQSWTFRNRPAGHGDLALSVRVKGETFDSQTRNGLHFVDGKAKVGLRYGNATWVDAIGNRTDIVPRWTGEVIELRVPESVILASKYPAVLDPTVSPEFGVDNPVIALGVGGREQRPKVARGNGQYFVTWSDWREWTPTMAIMGARVAFDGTVLDPVGITISTLDGSGSDPDVAFDGVNYLVVFNGHGVRVRAADGALLDGPATAPRGLSFRGASSVIFDGTNFLVLAGNHATRVRPGDLAILDGPDGFAFTTSGGGGAVAFDGTNYLFAWADQPAPSPVALIHAARVRTSDLTLLDPPEGFLVNSAGGNAGSMFPAVAFDGTNYLIAWGYVDIHAMRVRASDGALLDGPPSSGGIRVGSGGRPSVASDGTNFFVTWTNSFNGYGARIRCSDGALLPGIFLSPGAPGSVTFDGTNYFVVWDQTGSGTNIFGAHVRPSDGAVLEGPSPFDPSARGTLISQATRPETAPVAAFDGTNYLVVWLDGTGLFNSVKLMAARVRGTDGSMLDPSGIVISTADSNFVGPGSVAFDGTNYLVVWSDNRGHVYGARVRASDGVLLDGPPATAGFQISSATGSQPRVIFDGTNYFVVWTNGSTGSIYGSRVAPNASILDTGTLIAAPTTSSLARPAVAFDGTNYLVVWEGQGVAAARVRASDGALLDRLPSAGGVFANSGDHPDVAFDGTNYLLVWNANGSVSGNRLRPSDGLLLNGTSGISVSIGSPVSPLVPSVGFDGTNYLVAWEGQRGGTRTDVYGARVRPSDGVLLDGPPTTGGIAISVEPNNTNSHTPRVASSRAGKSLVVYARFTREPLLGGLQVRARFVGEAATCTTSADCASTFCVDGVCCDTACGGGSTADCQACSLAAGASADGTCGVAHAGTVCRPSTNVCEVPTKCDGLGVTCPALQYATSGTACRPATTVCDVPEYCPGTSNACPADLFADAGVVCRVAVSACDVSEVCSGTAQCAPDLPAANGVSCGDAGVCVDGLCGAIPDSGIDGGRDASTGDAGADSSTGDAGPDGAIVDAGRDAVAGDAGTDDASAVDAAQSDGAREDGASTDAARDANAGDQTDPGSVAAGGGCSCRVSRPRSDIPASASVMALLLVLACRRRARNAGPIRGHRAAMRGKIGKLTAAPNPSKCF